MYQLYQGNVSPIPKKTLQDLSMEEQIVMQQAPIQSKGFSVMQTLGVVALAMLITAVGTIFAIKSLLFSPPFDPVTLSSTEEQHLSTKLSIFEGFGENSQNSSTPSTTTTLAPEKYSEDDVSRNVAFTEREINAMVAKNTDLADKLAIDLAQDMISIKLLIPLDPDFPVLGGKTFKVKAGAELAYKEGRPVVKLKGVSLMGVPMPNSWLGGLKNIDLVKEYGADEGFWKAFSDGVESIGVEEGSLRVELKP
jgi:hypothetical protein